ncbi:SixA phosphatase family protein [Anaeromyxobacter paludicola]|uniref:Phosphohistidine phosphatase SixA n=1 Tax=Anaeromyxobacter paludicola TaxID=2918171 RepID=A0ABM7XG35_9BACT|nr:phosphoglycerate mutase family protein [Anaeromyxobacter paludicola]BDG10865.1 phosphohistidine phosphatase SixA [Anaeromyxobacter paludicola]
MKLVLLRHGIAEDRAPGGDEARRLTRPGRKKLARGARGLARLLDEVDAWAASPLARAVETARIAADELGGPDDPEELDALRPEAPPGALLPWLRRQPVASTALVAGHAPHLPALAAFLLGAPGPLFELEKGGACLLELPRAPRAGSARLGWLLTAKQLRKLGDA